MPEVTSRLSTALANRYRIERHLGAGGMATVYLAEDLKHKRKVALKVLKPDLAAVLGAERFVQEITTTAGLQHPHILPLFDSGEADGFLYYVMPYIAGETLRDKLDRETQLGIDEAVRIATELADALDYAHRHNVIHRDIKPENILLHDGRPMVADFGIALAVSAAAGGRMTETGLSLGTPHYMSPEQATAEKDLTNRSDIYSLGVVLYEMLTGDPPHTGSSAQQIIMKIVTDEARPVTELRKSVPAGVAFAIAKSVAKLPADRFASAADFATALTDGGTMAAAARSASAVPISRVVPPTSRLVWRVVPWAIAIAAVAWAMGSAGSSDAGRVASFVRLPRVPLYTDPSGILAVSPDGSHLAYVAIGQQGQQLFVHAMDELEPRALPGTGGAEEPTFSPDGQWIAFLTNLELQKVPITGGAPVFIAEVLGNQRGAHWGDDDFVVMAPNVNGGLLRVSADGGMPDTLIWPDREAGETAFRWPEVLPGGRAVLYTDGGSLDEMRVMVYDLESGDRHQLASGMRPRYARSGHLLYVTPGGVINAVPFDPDRLEVTGAARSVAEGVLVEAGGGAEYDISDDGVLVYFQGGSDASELVTIDQNGSERMLLGEARNYVGVSYSPTGTMVAVAVAADAATDIWVYDLALGTLARRTFGRENTYPSWSPDGRDIVFSSDRSGVGRGLWLVPADGSGQPRPLYGVESPSNVYEGEWSPDGSWFVFRETGAATGRDIFAFQIGEDTTIVPVVSSAANERSLALSPDGAWLAYTSNKTGQDEIYVQEFPGPGGIWLVSSDGGAEPLWAPDGRELYYRTSAEFIVARVETTPTFRVLGRDVLFPDRYLRQVSYRRYDVHPNGDSFVMVKATGLAELIVTLNWMDRLRD